jgi:hypothetical protein
MFKPAIVFAFLAALAGGLMACSGDGENAENACSE